MPDRIPYSVLVQMKNGDTKTFQVEAKSRANAKYQLSENTDFREWAKTINEDDIETVYVSIDMARYNK